MDTCRTTRKLCRKVPDVFLCNIHKFIAKIQKILPAAEDFIRERPVKNGGRTSVAIM